MARLFSSSVRRTMFGASGLATVLAVLSCSGTKVESYQCPEPAHVQEGVYYVAGDKPLVGTLSCRALAACSMDGQRDCHVKDGFAAAAVAGLAAKIPQGTVVAGIEGTAVIEALSPCTKTSQMNCVTNDSFRAVAKDLHEACVGVGLSAPTALALTEPLPPRFVLLAPNGRDLRTITADLCRLEPSSCLIADEAQRLFWTLPEPQPTNLADASDGCRAHAGWRLPTQRELMYAYLAGVGSLFRDAMEHASPAAALWAGAQRGIDETGEAWRVDLTTGSVERAAAEGLQAFVCVRDSRGGD